VAGIQVLHATAGRLRINAPVVKRDPAHAAILLDRLRAVRGVSRVEANPITRNVVILYEPPQVSQTALYAHLESLFGRVTTVRSTRSVASDSDLRALLGRALLKSAMEAAIQRAVFALI
jgi:hypothetical protein